MAKIIITADRLTKAGDCETAIVSFCLDSDGTLRMPQFSPYCIPIGKQSIAPVGAHVVCDTADDTELALFARAMRAFSNIYPNYKFQTRPAPVWLLNEQGERATG